MYKIIKNDQKLHLLDIYFWLFNTSKAKTMKKQSKK